MTQTRCAAAPLTFQTPASTGGRWHGWVIGGVSLVAHVVLIWVLSFPSPPPAKKPAKVIAARLLLQPPSPRPAQQSALPQASDTAAKADNHNSSSTDPQRVTATSTAEDQQPGEPEVSVRASRAEEAPPRDVSPKASLVQPQHEATTSVTTRMNPRAALDTYMSEKQQQAILEDGANEALFRQRRALGTAFSQSALSQQTADGPKPTRVNCSSGLNKTLAMLSGLAGGSLRCSEQPDLDPYLEKRLNAHTSK